MWLRLLTLIVFVNNQLGEKSNALPIEDEGYVLAPGIGRHKAYSLPKSWNEARSICQKEGGDLAIINSEDEAQVVIKLLKLSLPRKSSVNSNYGYIGFRDPFQDVHPTTVENENFAATGFYVWLRNEPNDRSGFEDCKTTLNGDLPNCTANCNPTAAFICERPESANELVLLQGDIEVNGEPVVEGGELRLTCNVRGRPAPEIHWAKDNYPLEENNRTKTPGNKLIIQNVDKNDTGRYRCDAENEYDSIIRDIVIAVMPIEPVKVNISTNEGNFNEGTEIGISCIVSGYPTPAILWYKDNGIIRTSDRVKISEANVLIISSADKTDTGKYRCEATNNFTSDARTLDVVVFTPVEGNITIDKGQFFKGSEISISCNADGFPTPAILWYKNNIPIRRDNRVKISGNKLTVSSADKNDAGTYKCVASNKYTEAISTADILVVEPVRVELAVDQGPFHRGSKVSIACNVEGYPPPTLSWYKDDNLIETDNRIKIYPYELIIAWADENDAGQYTCEAANQYTNSAHTVDVKVVAPVKVNVAMDTGPFLEGSEISISCNVDGYPTPLIQWYKDDNLVQTTSRIRISSAPHGLVIFNAIKSDTARYRCEATNKYGSGASAVDVSVWAKIVVNLVPDSITDWSCRNVNTWISICMPSDLL